MRDAVSYALIAVGVALLVTSGAIFIRAQTGYKAAQSAYQEIQQLAVKDSSGDGVPAVDFKELSKVNPDVVGWIYVPDTVISYPVVQTDNNEKYLHKLFDLSGNGAGSIFMDMVDAAPGLVDQQTTLYGHHMYDGSMFKQIDDTLKQENFDKIKTVYYITPENTYVLEPLFTAQVEDTYLDARVPSFEDEQAFRSYLDDLLGYAKATSSNVEKKIGDTDQVLSLVTCAGEIIPRTTRAVMVCSLTDTVPRQ